VNKLKGYNSYERIQAEEMDQSRLILMMYAGAIQSLQKAQKFHSGGKNIKCSEELSRVKMIVLELLGSINLDAGELAQNLSRIYISLFRNLIHFNSTKDPALLTGVRKILENLEGAWKTVFASDEYKAIIAVAKRRHG